MNTFFKFIKLSALIIPALLLMSFTVYGQKHDDINQLKSMLSASQNNEQKTDLYLRLATQYLTKPGELKADMDSAHLWNRAALKLSREQDFEKGEAQALLLDGRIRLEAGEKEKAHTGVNNALAFAKKHDLLIIQGECYEALAQFYDNENEGIEHKLRLIKNAVDLYHEAGDKEKEATALKLTGDYLHIRGRGEEALAALQQSLVIYKEIGFKELQGVYNLLGNVYTTLGNYQLAIKYELQAAQTAEKLGDYSLQLSSIYNHIALTYYFIKDDKQALFYWAKAKSIAEKYNDAGYMQTILSNMATSWIRMKQYEKGLSMLAEIEKKYPPTELQMRLRIPYIYFNTYMILNRLDKLPPLYNKLLEFERTLPDDDANQIYLTEAITAYLIKIKDLKGAYYFLRKQDKLLENGNNYLSLSQNQYKWFKADSTAGNLKSAINHFIKYKILSDSVFNTNKAKQISSLQIQFETNQKDRDIKLLTQKNGLQADTIRKDKLIKFYTTGAIVLLFLLLVLSFIAYRSKQKSNAQLRAKQDEINSQYDILKRVLNEKEWLLREIHHRVKNNLQIVISLLNTQSAYIENQDAMDAIQNSQHRMHAMSLIHQKLYQSDSLATIDMKWYIHELISYMRECFDIDASIRFVIEVEDLALDVAQAVPVGLILNEAVTNAIKYAFTDGRFGTIKIGIENREDGCSVLTITDNGKGLPEDFDIDNLNSLGLNLMRGLAGQLEGEFDMTTENGLHIAIAFPVKHSFNDDTLDEVRAA